MILNKQHSRYVKTRLFIEYNYQVNNEKFGIISPIKRQKLFLVFSRMSRCISNIKINVKNEKFMKTKEEHDGLLNNVLFFVYCIASLS